MSMMTSEILKFLDFTKTPKSRYLENKTLFVLQIKKSINYKSKDYFMAFVAEVTSKSFLNHEIILRVLIGRFSA